MSGKKLTGPKARMTKVYAGKRKRYSERTDLEKIESNWNKTGGLFKRKEWSSAIVRAAIVCEIAANLAIREELQAKLGLKPEFVDSLLKWANGIQGKFDRLLLPVTKGTKHHNKLKKLKSQVNTINLERNSVAHSGEFKNKDIAKNVLNQVRNIVLTIVNIYNEDFDLDRVT